MEQTLKVTNVLSDPTRFHIYQYLIENHKEVSVTEIAKEFNIHPNVARLHLSKLEDIRMVVSYSQKTGKGGRPSRLYRLSENVIELNFPHRDYKLLSSIVIESLAEMGETGKQALYTTGEKYGRQIIEDFHHNKKLSTMEKLNILEDASTMLGMYTNFVYNEEKNSIKFEVNNCPFKELASKNHDLICDMHHSFIKGMFEVLFSDIDLVIEENMFINGCDNCSYTANLLVNN
ncbi:helix-turn-helix transcriptional regulator [Oceanobacillus halophilus]|uniref:HTH domain-containing protein n=1 Tax=Oceanobacillus halophilus TaxID=930130 RepID=A0A495ACU5_9BACI|nr:helix-turn-helix domain-containing protein [Oceanobacillus halophilus]RKQ37786.1 HTH domain-containing protein [Oceanobacillus halophilus]